uniref:Uncharacterized protein n=1 Tax=Anopheles farauti TaxID=69004 RepID=A0A182QF42_9DIPT
MVSFLANRITHVHLALVVNRDHVVERKRLLLLHRFLLHRHPHRSRLLQLGRGGGHKGHHRQQHQRTAHVQLHPLHKREHYSQLFFTHCRCVTVPVLDRFSVCRERRGLLVLMAVLVLGSCQALTPIDSAVDMLAEESQVRSASATYAEAAGDAYPGSVRDKRGLKYQYHYKEKSVGGLFPFKHVVERKVHIKHGHHGLLGGGGHYREVTKVKQFGFGR